MLRRLAPYLGLVVGLALGATLSYVERSDAARNSSGTYSLPSGNPVVSGTTITSTWANTTTSDMATEFTNSLDRNGRGAMLAPLQCSNGSAAAPSMTFGSDPDTGAYRCAANEFCIAAGGSKIAGITSSGAAVTGAVTASAGVVATQSTADGDAVQGTGNGNGEGGRFTGGSGGFGIVATGGGGNTSGGAFTGAGTAAGITSTGGATGSGVTATAGGSPTADTNTRYAFEATGGHIKLSGGNPTGTTNFQNVVTPMNVAKAFIRSNPASLTVRQSFNVTSIADSGANNIAINFGQDFSDTNYSCWVSGDQSAVYNWTPTNAGTVTISAIDVAGATFDLSDNGGEMTVICFGAQ